MNAGEREGLREVLAAHRNVSLRRGKADRRGIALNENVCECGEVLPWGLTAMEVGHVAHVEAAVLDWLRARLASDEVREAVAAEWQRPEHAPMSDHDPRTGECVSCPWPAYMVLGPSELADAALTAVLAALEVER